MLFSELTDEILIRIFSFIDVADILKLRQTCKRLEALSRLRTVWLAAYHIHVTRLSLQSDGSCLDELSSGDLERRACRAMRLKDAWSVPQPKPHRTICFSGGRHGTLLDVRFVLRERHEWLVTFVQGIWPEVKCWDLGQEMKGGKVGGESLNRRGEQRVVGEWACGNLRMVSNGIAVNTGERKGADLAISVLRNHQSEHLEVVLLSIDPGRKDGEVEFTVVDVVKTEFRPVSLQGDILVVSDDHHETRILNWKSGCSAILHNRREPVEDEASIMFDSCLQVFFAHESILVARSCTVDLYPSAELRPSGEVPVVYPIRSHTFGWIDGIVVGPVSALDAVQSSYPTLAILVRAESGDPWESNIHFVQKYLLYPDPNYNGSLFDDTNPIPSFSTALSLGETSSRSASAGSSSPYIFPPKLVSTIPSTRGFLRCPTLALGHAGTALWIHSWRPHNAQTLGTVVSPTSNSGELLCAAIFPGPFSSGHDGDESQVSVGTVPRRDEDDDVREDVKPIQLYQDPGDKNDNRVTWTSLDYVESRGCIALGAMNGSVTVLEMI